MDWVPTLSEWQGPMFLRIVDALASFYVKADPWTAEAPLPGGDFEDLDAQLDATLRRYPFLAAAQLRRLVLAYGTRVKDVLGEMTPGRDPGPVFGAELTAAEVRYLMQAEWARTADDVLWRRSKLGLAMPRPARDALAQFMQSVRRLAHENAAISGSHRGSRHSPCRCRRDLFFRRLL